MAEVAGRKASLRWRALAGAAMLAVAGLVGPALAADPVKGGSLVVARPADIFTFDPYNTQDDRSIFTELTIYDRLVKLHADGTGVEPELATAWSVSKDGLPADFTGENRKPHEPFWSMARVSEKTTSSAVSGLPSENLTPDRKVKSAVSPSLLTLQAVASSGSTPVPSAFSFTRRS